MENSAHFTAKDRTGPLAGHYAVQPNFLPRCGVKGFSLPGKFANFPTTRHSLLQQDFTDLTGRERMILQLLGHGLSNKETAKRLNISPETVKSHIKSIFLKLDVERRAQAVSRAVGLGVIAPD